MTNNNSEKDNIFLNWHWYLLLGSCFLLLFGFALSWILVSKEIIPISFFYIPSLICSLIALITLGWFIYIDSKDLFILKVHVPKKIFKLYFASFFIIFLAFLFSIIYLFFFQISEKITTDTFFIIGFIVVSTLTLIGIGLYRYTKYKIDLILYLRRRGKTQDDKKQKTTSNDISQSSSKIVDGIKE